MEDSGFGLEGMGFMRLADFSTSSRGTGSSRENYDRFIPNRSAMDFDMAHYLLVDSWKGKPKNPVAMSPSGRAYDLLLKELLMKNSGRILAFKNMSAPCESLEGVFGDAFPNPAGQWRRIPQSPDRRLGAPGLVNDYYLNLLDWGSSVSIALGSRLYLWDASDGSTLEMMAVDEPDGPLTSISWAPDARHIAVGLNSSDIQLWDADSGHLVRTLRGAHRAGVGSLAWNGNAILTSGGMDGLIINHDLRIGPHIVQTCRGHRQEVCCLKWSGSGEQLASRGNDNLLYIWERNRSVWLHKLADHTAAVKALAWCPSERNLLASGGSGNERRIDFWSTSSGSCLNSVDTGYKVRNLVWNKSKRELLSSHGLPQNQLTLWKYPSMDKLAEVTGNAMQFLHMAQSPDGCTVASAGDEALELWNVFPEVPKPASNMDNRGPLVSPSYIR